MVDSTEASSAVTQPADTFASGRYSKRKRTQITYAMQELEISDDESDFEKPSPKNRKTVALSSRPLSKRKIFPFLKLPAEIRIMIYDFALTDSSGINLVASFKHMRRTVERVSSDCMEKLSRAGWSVARLNRNTRNGSAAPTPLAPSFLVLCKQTYQESRETLYNNEFVFADSFAMYSFLINLGPARSKYLNSLRLLNWGEGRTLQAYNHACFSVLVWATNITSFQIDAHVDTHVGKKGHGGAERLYRDAFPWMEAVGIAKGRADAAVDILKFGRFCFNRSRRYWAQRLLNQQEYEEQVDSCKETLSKFLNEQQKRLLEGPAKKTKRTKKQKV